MPTADNIVSMQVLLFAVAAELANADSVTVQVGLPITADEFLTEIGKACPPLLPWLASCRLAVEQSFVPGDHVIERIVNVALIPPVSGG